MLDTTPLHPRYVPATFPMLASCIPVLRGCLFIRPACLRGASLFRYRRFASLTAGEGAAPLNPGKPKGRESNEARQARPHAAVVVRVFPEERDILRFNAGLHGMSMSDYIRQTCLGIRLRKTPEEKRRLRELHASARTSINLRDGPTPISGRRKPWRY